MVALKSIKVEKKQKDWFFLIFGKIFNQFDYLQALENIVKVKIM